MASHTQVETTYLEKMLLEIILALKILYLDTKTLFNISQTIQVTTCTVFSTGMGKEVEKTEALYQPVFYLMKCLSQSLYVD